MTDLRLAVRSLRTTPIVAGVAVLSLALGIGASIAIFSLANSLLLRQLPVRDPSALVLVTDSTVPGVRAYAFGVWESFHRLVDVFDGTLAWSPAEFNLVPRGEAQIVSGAWVSGSYFEVLGVPPQLGRVLGPSDDRRSGGVDGPVAVISHVFWQRYYGAAPDVVGRSLTLDGASFTVIGVTPQHFSGLDVGRRADVFVPFGAASSVPGHANLQVTVMARRRANQTVDAATIAVRRAGVVLGAGASLWATQFTKSLLFGLEPRDPVTFAIAALLLIGAGMLAALPPAWKASHVDPSVALRTE